MTTKHINFFCVPEAAKLLWCTPSVAAREYPEPPARHGAQGFHGSRIAP
ncbi:hypothetical protein OH687_28860 [Burkholderia anthina]|nr:hypothetical protein OH687_28860 [Burkholderia anthina]